MTDRVVLAYSGGLDTSVGIGWIAEETGADVVAVAVDVGQGGEDLEEIRKRALACGAVEAVVADARDEFAEQYCLPALQAHALYMDRYPLVSALSRPLIVKHLVDAAKQYGATTVAHGCTGKGNDQVRFEVGIQALAPELTVHRAGPRLRVDPGEGDPVRRGPRSPDRDQQAVAVLDRPERLGPCGRDGVPGGHLERADRRRLLLHARPGACRASRTRSSSGFEKGVPVAIDGDPRHDAAGDPGAQRARGRARDRPARHGRRPAGRHQEPRGVRGARRDRADHRAPGAGERHGRARPRPVQAHRLASAGPSSSTTGCGSPRSRRRSTRSSRRARSTSPVRCG